MYLTLIIDQKDNKLYYPRSIAAESCEAFLFEKDYFDVLGDGTYIFPRHFKGLMTLQNIRDAAMGMLTPNCPSSLFWIEQTGKRGLRFMTTVVYQNQAIFSIEMSLPKDQRFLIVTSPHETAMLNLLVKGAKTLTQVKEVAHKHNFFLPEGWYEYHVPIIAARDIVRVRKSVRGAMFRPPKSGEKVQDEI